MAIINKNALKREFNKLGMRIGKDVLDFYIQIEKKKINNEIEKIVRNAKISGRKTIRKEDVDEI